MYSVGSQYLLHYIKGIKKITISDFLICEFVVYYMIKLNK